MDSLGTISMASYTDAVALAGLLSDRFPPLPLVFPGTPTTSFPSLSIVSITCLPLEAFGLGVSSLTMSRPESYVLYFRKTPAHPGQPWGQLDFCVPILVQPFKSHMEHLISVTRNKRT